MRLPDNIYKLATVYFGHHGCWHYLRLVPDDLGGQEIRANCFPPKEFRLWPGGLRMQGAPGSGEDFLKFHRMMIRNFKWVVMTSGLPKYFYVPWPDFPIWLSSILDAMDPFYRQRLSCAVDEMILNASLDDLGRFIEGSPKIAAFPDIHSKVHSIVSVYEQAFFGPQPASDMGNPYLSACNEHFWRFHGWIDEIYARWQTAHGENVDQSPLKPMEKMKMCTDCKRRIDSTSPWLAEWQDYLQSRSE